MSRPGGDLPEEHTPNRALPQWAIDSLLFGMPKYASAAKIWGRMLSIAMSAQARGWTRMEFINEVTKTERRKNSFGQKRLTEHKLWLQLKACSRDEGHALQQLEKAWAQGIEEPDERGLPHRRRPDRRRRRARLPLGGPSHRGQGRPARQRGPGDVLDRTSIALDLMSAAISPPVSGAFGHGESWTQT